MKKCIRCGKEIDVISRNPEKVFYCRACSLKMMNLTEDDLNFEYKEEIVEDTTFWVVLIKIIKSFIPGINQLVEKEFLKGIIFLFSGIFLPISWIFMTLFLVIMNVDETVKFSLFILGLLILINGFFVFLKNLLEIWKKGDN